MTAVKRLIVVGGGSAGWISAALLDATLNRGGRRNIDITLVESASVGRIGVGEATIPPLRATLQTIGIGEQEFMRRTGATFKHGVRFMDWRRPPGQPNNVYHHPFEAFGRQDAIDVAQLWLGLERAGRPVPPYADFVGIQASLSAAGRAPKKLEHADYRGPLPYAYHVDAEAFADLLCDLATGRGVRRIVDDVTKVNCAPNGFIQSVTTRNNGDIVGDLFIDCTGFASVLIEKTLGVPFDDYSGYLLCDRAVGIRASHTAANPSYRPFTSATARDSGWIWDIDLYGRRGVGYVYSSAFMDEAAAEEALRNYIGPAAKDVPARHLKMRVGRRRQLWKGNCVAVGLSGGFIEPLESTGIYFIDYAITLLLLYFPFGGMSPALIDRYNYIMTERYNETRDFIVAHYCLSQREDTPFWREVRQPGRIPDSLKERFVLWAERAPQSLDINTNGCLFGPANYEFVLYGMGWQPSPRDALIRPLMPPVSVDAVQKTVHDARIRAMADLPDHTALLNAIHRDVAPAAAARR